MLVLLPGVVKHGRENCINAVWRPMNRHDDITCAIEASPTDVLAAWRPVVCLRGPDSVRGPQAPAVSFSPCQNVYLHLEKGPVSACFRPLGITLTQGMFLFHGSEYRFVGTRPSILALVRSQYSSRITPSARATTLH